MLERMNNTVRRKDLLHAIPRLQANGISCHASFIVGFPGEAYETVDDTIDLIERARPDFFCAQLWCADPMTPIWKRREQFGVRGQAISWSHATMDAERARDLINRMFHAIEHSSWLPQHGFEQWSTFYLQRQGMTLRQIRALVASINAAIKDKLLGVENPERGPEAVLAAGMATLIARVCDTDDVVFLEVLDGMLLPMRLRLSWSDGCRNELVQTVSAKLNADGSGGRSSPIRCGFVGGPHPFRALVQRWRSRRPMVTRRRACPAVPDERKAATFSLIWRLSCPSVRMAGQMRAPFRSIWSTTPIASTASWRPVWTGRGRMN